MLELEDRRQEDFMLHSEALSYIQYYITKDLFIILIIL